MFEKSLVMYQILLDPPKSPFLRGTLIPFPPLKRGTLIPRTYALKPRSPLAPLKKGGTSKAPFLRGLGDLSA